jgi:RimJ/RimL family protein N-acetyltransferase
MRIRLLPIDSDLQQTFHSPAAFEQQYACTYDDVVTIMDNVITQLQVLYAQAPRESRWGGYFAVDEDTRKVVGTCAFTDQPTNDGEIEIAYFTFPPYEGQGYATAMAVALVDIARRSPQVATILAHTLPEPNASTRILTKLGMTLRGEAVDPQAGPVWRWECGA